MSGFGMAASRAIASDASGSRYGYAAPEQDVGGAVDGRSAVWSVGVMLWKPLTGKRLFEAGIDSGAAEAATKRHVTAPSSVVADVSCGARCGRDSALSRGTRRLAIRAHAT